MGETSCLSQREIASYDFNPVLRVMINGQILRRSVFLLDVTRGVMSVTKSTGFAAYLVGGDLFNLPTQLKGWSSFFGAHSPQICGALWALEF